MTPGRDFDFYDLLEGENHVADPVFVESTHPMYLLHTSGTTGNPKGILRDTGGTATALYYSMKHIMGIKEGQCYFSASDIGKKFKKNKFKIFFFSKIFSIKRLGSRTPFHCLRTFTQRCSDDPL